MCCVKEYVSTPTDTPRHATHTHNLCGCIFETEINFAWRTANTPPPPNTPHAYTINNARQPRDVHRNGKYLQNHLVLCRIHFDVGPPQAPRLLQI